MRTSGIGTAAGHSAGARGICEVTWDSFLQGQQGASLFLPMLQVQPQPQPQQPGVSFCAYATRSHPTKVTSSRHMVSARFIAAQSTILAYLCQVGIYKISLMADTQSDKIR